MADALQTPACIRRARALAIMTARSPVHRPLPLPLRSGGPRGLAVSDAVIARRQWLGWVGAAALGPMAGPVRATTDEALAAPPAADRTLRHARGLSLVVPYAAGGPLDRAARHLAQQTKGLGAVDVLNVPGEGGATGTAMVGRAGGRDPMLLMGAVATHAILPWLNPQLPYDPLRDFQPLLLVARMPHVLVMRQELAQQWRIEAPADLLRFMAKHKQPLRYASGGRGSIGHLAGEMFQTLTRTPLQHLPFGGARPALSALLEGSADLMFDNLASALPHLQAGRLRAIAVTSVQPVAQLPRVPSLNDTLAGFNLSTWFGLFASAGVSPALAQRWTNGFAATLRQKDVQHYLDSLGVLRENLQLGDFAHFVRSEHAKYGQLLQSSGMRLASN